MKELYGIELPGFKYDRLWDLRRAIERASGIAMPPHEPLIGEGVFSHESGMHTAGIAIHPAIYQFIREETVGGSHRFIFGKHTGAAAVEHVLNKHIGKMKAAGIDVTDDLIKKLVNQVKELREERLKTGNHERIIAEYYRSYTALGITEEELLALALGEKSTV